MRYTIHTMYCIHVHFVCIYHIVYHKVLVIFFRNFIQCLVPLVSYHFLIPNAHLLTFFYPFIYTPFLQMKLITTSALQERLKINGSLARSAIKLLLKKKLIKKVHVHHAQRIYTRATHE